MYISQENPGQTQRRLLRVAAAARVELLESLWWFEEFPFDGFPGRVRPDAIALVRDQDGWSQLVPVLPSDRPPEQFFLWCCHFPDGLDNSGFVGWLATRIKERTGSGLFVVCGQNSARGGIYDYWGCPADARETVLAELQTLTSEAQRAIRPPEDLLSSLEGMCMRVVATAAGGEIGADTVFAFSQVGSTVSARYSGGRVRLGYLVGTLAGRSLAFRYAQVDQAGQVDGGRSICELSLLPDGRLRLVENFEWESRRGSGTNILEQIG